MNAATGRYLRSHGNFRVAFRSSLPGERLGGTFPWL